MTTNPTPSTPSGGARGETGWWVATFVIGMTALILAVVAVFVSAGDRSDAAPVSGGQTSFQVELGEMYVEPSSITVPAGQQITIEVTNRGVMAHDLVFDGGGGTELLAPGASQTVTVGPFTASTTGWCTVPGHREAGMVMAVSVLGGSGTSSGSPDHGAATVGGTTTGAQIDANATPADGWAPRDPVMPTTPTGAVHEFTLVASEEVVEVAPGVTQELWLFGGQYPGPVMRGKVGDTFRITLVNEGRVGHSIDFHASKVAWNKEMRTINSGESLVYEFTADFAGVFMYHCGTAPALHHIGNGMHGMIVIDPPELAPVEEEFFLVQSELYLGPEGQPGDLGKMMNDAWDAVVFNGYHNQYLHSPIPVEADQRYRVYVMNNGPSENSAFHIVGTVFDTVYKEGNYLLQPDELQGGSQVLDLQPAQGGFVEFTFAVDGLYPIVTHKFSNVGKGALGLFAAGDVSSDGAGH